MIDSGKRNIMGVLVDAVDYEAAVTRIINAACQRRPLAVSALAVHGVMTGVLDTEHKYRLNRLDLVVPDGQPVRWALNCLHRARLPDRLCGPELTLKVCEAAARDGLATYFYGSTPDMLQALRQNLLQWFPNLRIAGMQASKFRTISLAEKLAVVDEITSSGAAIVFVGLGCPRQEVWAYEFRNALSVPVISVGAAFAFHAGLLGKAPLWMQRYGLEWLFRLKSEPRRLWRRYVLLNPAFLFLLFGQSLGFTFSTDGEAPQGELLYG
jgi:N-acetylglucosaminyldiphosphoundecaprenol N-acetyl-beta-D-mannosaminyltransferase